MNNWYSYVQGDPINNVDPTGYKPEDVNTIVSAVTQFRKFAFDNNRVRNAKRSGNMNDVISMIDWGSIGDNIWGAVEFTTGYDPVIRSGLWKQNADCSTWTNSSDKFLAKKFPTGTVGDYYFSPVFYDRTGPVNHNYNIFVSSLKSDPILILDIQEYGWKIFKSSKSLQDLNIRVLENNYHIQDRLHYPGDDFINVPSSEAEKKYWGK